MTNRKRICWVVRPLWSERMCGMAPKNKFTREEMVAAAVQVVRGKGIDALTAKALAEELGTSTQPVFTCFGAMDAVKDAVQGAATLLYDEYVAKGLKEKIPFYGVGMQFIRFAREEPQLYRLLFLTQTEERDGGALEAMKRSQTMVVPFLERIYRIGEKEAKRYFRDLWLVVHSIATLIVTGGCTYSDAEIGMILTGFSISIYKAMKEVPGFVDGAFDRDEIFRKLIEE